MIYNFENLTFNILTAAKFKHTDGVFKVKGRPYSALSYRTSGTGAFFTEEKSFVSSPGDIVFIPAHKDYNVRYESGESIAIHLLDCSYNCFENISPANFTMVKLCFDELLESNGEFNAQKSVIYKILHILASSHAIHDSDLKRCVEFIGQNFCTSQLSVSDICKAACISESTLRRKFQAFFGQSCEQYITKLRLSNAIDLITRGEFSVKEAAHQCGFDDEKYFSRLVKRKYGAAPSDFKSR